MRACRGLFVSDANRRDASPRGFSVFGRDSLHAKRKIGSLQGSNAFRPTFAHPSLWTPEMPQLKARTLSCSDHGSGRLIRLSSVSALSSAGCCPWQIASTMPGAANARRERRST